MKKKNLQTQQNKMKSAARKVPAPQPQQQKQRKRPGSGGTGDFYHIAVRPREEFEVFRTHDVGQKGHLERVAGQRPDGSWDTVKWLVSKKDAKVKNNKLCAQTEDIQELIERLGSQPKWIEGDNFEIKDFKVKKKN